jgi:hypothetical protein
MSLESRYNKIHNHPAGRISLHIALWLFFYGLQFYILEISLGSIDPATAYWIAFKNTLATMIAFYPLIYLVWLSWWQKRKYLLTAIGTIAVILIYALTDYALERLILNTCQTCVETLKRNQPDYYDYLQHDAPAILIPRIISLGIVYQLILSLAIPAGIKFILVYIKQRVETLKLKNENMMLELNLLKAQVNPHFLFNTLNNIYSLILKEKKHESAETVARLSAFLRYSLYNTNEQNNLVKEVDVLNDYIALEKIRLNHTNVEFTYETDNASYALPPLLFIPAVENAFKFCTEEKGKVSSITIRLEVKDSLLRFQISNTYDRFQSEKEHSGIGLENLMKRLQRYYPGRHKFEINKTESMFNLFVEINLGHD